MSTETVDIVVKETGAAQAATDIHRIGNEAERSAEKVQSLNEASSMLRETLVALGLAIGIEKWVEMTDTFVQMENQLRLTTESMKDFHDVQEALFEVSQKTFSSVSANTEIYAKMARATQGLGVDHQGLTQVIKAIDMGFLAEGKSAEQAEAGVRKLAFAFSTGQINGRVLMTLFQQMPVLTNSLAHSFFSGAGAQEEFYAAMKGGSITTKDLLDKLAKLGAEGSDLSRIMELITPTIANAWQTMKNAVLQYFGEADKASGASAAVAHTLMFLASNINTVIPVVTGLTIALTLAAFQASIFRGAIGAMLTPWGLLSIAIGGAVAAFLEFGHTSFTVFGQTTNASTILHNALSKVWQLVQNASPWGIAAGAVGTLVVALRLLLGINVLGWITAATAALARMAVAATFALGPWGALAVAIAALSAAIAGNLGAFDSLIDKIKNGVTAAANDLSAALEKTAGDLGLFKDGASGAETAAKKLTTSTKDLSYFTHQLALEEKYLQGLLDESMKKLQALDSTVNKTAGDVQNYMGEMVAATDAWAARSGAAYDDVKNKAIQMASAVDQATRSVQSSTSHAASAASGSAGPTQNFDVFTPSVQDNAAYTAWQFKNHPPPFPGDPAAAWQYAIQHGFDPKQNYGQRPPGYASGGSFTVGGPGGTDSQLVKFLATPGERVTVETPSQQQASPGGDTNNTFHVRMVVNTPDAESFMRSEQQIMTTLRGRLRRAGAAI